MTQILVTGGTGTLGRDVVARLLAHHHQVRALVHHAAAGLPEGVAVAPADLATGAGLDAAVESVDVVLHLASDSRHPLETDVGGTQKLITAARTRSSPAPHLIYCSIVGVDRPTTAYYAAKRAAGALVESSGLPWSILRATQFHSLVDGILQSLGIDAGPQVVVPAGVRMQSIAVAEVAERLVAIAELGPLGHVAEVGGPQVLDLEAMAATYLWARSRASTRVLAEPVESPLYDAWRSGVNLTPDHAFGTTTWEDYLTRTPSRHH